MTMIVGYSPIKLIKKDAFPNELKTTAMGSALHILPLMNKLIRVPHRRQASAQRDR